MTYLIGQQSNIENKRTNLLIRRLDAYENLTKFFPILNKRIPESFSFMTEFINGLPNFSDPTDVEYINSKDNLVNQLGFFSEFHYFLFSFNLRYGHLFEYNFQKEEYKNLIKLSSETNDFFISAQKSFRLGKNELGKGMEFEKFFNELTIFINELRIELE